MVKMYVICTYDVAEKRCVKVMKVLRKYMFHVQNSVFEGELTAWCNFVLFCVWKQKNKKRLSWKSTKTIEYYNLIFDYSVVFTVWIRIKWLI